MNKSNSLKFAELILLIIVWILMIFGPVLFSNADSLSLGDFIKPMESIIPLFIIFLINRFILVPGFLFKGKRLLYIFSVAGIIAIFTLGSFILNKPDIRKPPPNKSSQWQNPPSYPNKERLHLPPPEQGRNPPMPQFANILLFSILLIGFDTGLKVSFRLAETEKEKAKIQKENVKSQLAFLRNQISPHFFMNTLNNIHSLIDFDAEEAKESIIRLSKLMRHLLYESDNEMISIKIEMEFIKNYVDLMKLRFSDKVEINLQLPSQIPDKTIPPLLFTSYLENAFKHGISYEHSSFIKILISVTSNSLKFELRNSNAAVGDNNNGDSGIGIENSRKRLDLIYGDKYSLIIDDKDNEHSVRLSIPL